MCEIQITSVLDLRDNTSCDAVGLMITDLCSEVGDYGAGVLKGHRIEIRG